VSGGMTGLMREATRALLRDDIPSDVIAAALAPLDARSDVETAINRYRTARGPIGERMERLQFEMTGAIGGAERWATASPLGQLLGGQAVRRGLENDISYEQIASGLGISTSAAYGLEQAAVRAEREVNINRKVSRYDPGSDRPLAALADVVEDLRAAGVPVTGGLPNKISAPPAAAGGAGAPPPPPPATTAAPEEPEFGSQAWFESIEPIPYGEDAQRVPFSRDDLSPAERAKARETTVKIQGAVIGQIADVFIDVDEPLDIAVDHIFHLLHFGQAVLGSDNGQPDHLQQRNRQ